MRASTLKARLGLGSVFKVILPSAGTTPDRPLLRRRLGRYEITDRWRDW